METYYIVWWEYFNYEAGQYDEDGANGYAVDHYEPFQTLKEAEEAGWCLDLCNFDLHNSEYLAGNVMTEYEEKFVKKGNPICKMVIHK
jgi:tRNA (guanine-N7-)-methyltransferase